MVCKAGLGFAANLHIQEHMGGKVSMDQGGHHLPLLLIEEKGGKELSKMSLP